MERRGCCGRWFLRPELPKKEVPGAKVALVDPVDRVRRGWLSTSPPGKGLRLKKKEAVASFSCAAVSI